MARAQEPPPQVGGRIDPYVTESIARGRTAAENRLIQAIQEAGATARTKMAERGATERTAMQIQAQQAMQAAELAAQDRRAAEAEIARREDQKFATTMKEIDQAFTSEQSKIFREYQDAVQAREWDRADKIAEQVEEARRFDFELELDSNERTTNAIISMTKFGLERESNREKAITALMEKENEYERDKEIFDVTKQRTIDGFDTDKRMDRLTLEAAKKRLPTRWEILKQSIKGAAIRKGPQELVEKVRKLTEEIAQGFPDPLGVMQSQIDRTGASISVEELHPSMLTSLEQRIAENKIQAQDIRNVAAVIEGTLEVLNKKIRSAEEKDIGFWKDEKAYVLEMQNSLENLRKSERKVIGSDIETVGMRARTAFGVKGTSLGGRVSAVRNILGTTDYSQVLNEFTKPLSVPSLKPIMPKMTPYERKIREDYNAILLRHYPNLGGGI